MRIGKVFFNAAAKFVTDEYDRFRSLILDSEESDKGKRQTVATATDGRTLFSIRQKCSIPTDVESEERVLVDIADLEKIAMITSECDSVENRQPIVLFNKTENGSRSVKIPFLRDQSVHIVLDTPDEVEPPKTMKEVFGEFESKVVRYHPFDPERLAKVLLAIAKIQNQLDVEMECCIGVPENDGDAFVIKYLGRDFEIAAEVMPLSYMDSDENSPETYKANKFFSREENSCTKQTQSSAPLSPTSAP